MIDRNTIVEQVKFLLKSPVDSTELKTENVVSRAREILADTIEPYRWSNEQLEKFAGDGVLELRKIRSDVDNSGTVTTLFLSALANYCVYRALALDNDAQNNNGALSDKFFNAFVSLANSAPYKFDAEKLGSFANKALDELIAKRSDLRIAENGEVKSSVIVSIDKRPFFDIPDRFADAVAHLAAYYAALHSKNDAAQYFLEQFQEAVSAL